MKTPIRIKKNTVYEMLILGNSTQSLNFGWIYLVGVTGKVTFRVVSVDMTEGENELVKKELTSPGTIATIARGNGEDITKIYITTDNDEGFQGELHAELTDIRP